MEWNAVGWKDLRRIYPYAKSQLHQIILITRSTALKFNSFQGLIFLGFQSDGEYKLGEYKIQTCDNLFCQGSLEGYPLPSLGQLKLLWPRGYYPTLLIHLSCPCSMGASRSSISRGCSFVRISNSNSLLGDFSIVISIAVYRILGISHVQLVNFQKNTSF